jgi:hypothetical protein
MLNVFVMIYLDDIVIFSKSEEDHKIHVKKVLQRLEDHNLFCKPQKCHFFQSSIDLLGYHVDANGLSMDLNKVKAVVDWPVPQSSKHVQQFLEFINFYRTFIPDFSRKSVPLTRLLQKKESGKVEG